MQMARVVGLEIHRDTRYTLESLVSAGNSLSPFLMWDNAIQSVTQQKKLFLFNNSGSDTFTQIYLTKNGFDAAFDLQFAEDASGFPGTYALDKQLAVALTPGQSVAFWVRLIANAPTVNGVKQAYMSSTVIMQARGNKNNAGVNTYQYNADMILATTKRVESAPFASYSKVEGLRAEVDYDGYLAGFLASTDSGATWMDMTNVINDPNGAIRFPVPANSFIVRAEIASGAINEWTLYPFYEYRL